MGNTDRARLVFHGAVVLLVGLLCGLPTVVESIDETAGFWHTAHEALIMVGVWMLAATALTLVGARAALEQPGEQAAR